MNRKIIIFLLGIVLFLVACRNETTEFSNKEFITSAANKNDVLLSELNSGLALKSLWEEDVVFIVNTKKIFEKNINQIKFTNKYGTVLWEYAMSMGRMDETFAVVPILKNKKVTSLLQINRKDGKVFFSIDRNKENIEYFDVFVKTDKKNIEYKNRDASSMRTECIEYEYRYFTYDNEQELGVMHVVRYTTCFTIAEMVISDNDNGGSGFDYGGGGGSSSPNDMTPVLTIRDQIVRENPCMGPIYSQVTNDQNGIINDFISKFRPTNSLMDVNVSIYSENSENAGRVSINLNQIYMEFNNDFFGSNQTYLAKMIAHEYIHAHLFDELVRAVDPTLTREQAEKMNIFQLIDKNNVRQSFLRDSDGQHYIMANDYIDFLICVMKQYDNMKGFSHTEHEYKLLAWAGLENTPQFEKSGLLSATRYNETMNLIRKLPCTN